MTLFRRSSVLFLSRQRMIDLRSDTVTRPSRAMLETALTAATGDDVMGEDPTVQALEERVADRLGKPYGLFVPTGTMGNLCALSAHCDRRGMEVLVGSQSHICLYESGNVSTAGNLHSRQLQEDPVTAEFTIKDIVVRYDDDDHYCKTQVLCLENTHNMLGGIPLRPTYINEIGEFCRSNNLKLHMDGARLVNAVIASGGAVTAAEVCRAANSITVCLSKGLGAPLGSVLVSDDTCDFRRLAKRARKRYGGGMRQAGVVAAMGLYALEHNWDRIIIDHERAQALAERLSKMMFILTTAQPQTNMVFFQLPDDAKVTNQEFLHRLQKEFGILLLGGYSKTGNVFRAVTHLDLQDEDIDTVGNAMLQCLR